MIIYAHLIMVMYMYSITIHIYTYAYRTRTPRICSSPWPFRIECCIARLGRRVSIREYIHIYLVSTLGQGHRSVARLGRQQRTTMTVSYTQLTLPTIYSV